MDRRGLLQLALAAPLAGLPISAPVRAGSERAGGGGEPFSFAFLSDCHIRPEGRAAAACRACFEQVSATDHDFVIQGGDLVEDAAEVGRERAELLMELYQRTEQRHLRKPIRRVIGNHDCLGIFADSGIDPAASDYGKRFWTERFGPTYYTFDHKGVHFIVLDSIGLTSDRNYEGRVDGGQLAWLRRDLAAQPAGTRIIVVTHIPLVTAMRCYEPEAWLDTPHNWTYVVNGREVLRALKEYDVLAVLQGHSHVYEQIELNGIRFITTGAVAGADWQGNFLGTPEGYAEITVSGHTVTSRYVSYGSTDPDAVGVPI